MPESDAGSECGQFLKIFTWEVRSGHKIEIRHNGIDLGSWGHTSVRPNELDGGGSRDRKRGWNVPKMSTGRKRPLPLPYLAVPDHPVHYGSACPSSSTQPPD